MGVKSLVKQVLTEKENIRYRRLLEKRQMTYQDWLREMQSQWQRDNEDSCPGTIVDSSFVLFCAGNGEIPEYARKNIERYFIKHPEIQLLYGDEDTREEESVPWFKPDWSPDLLDSCFYFGSLVAMRREFFERMRDAASKTGDIDGTETFLQRKEEALYLVTDFERYVGWIYECVGAAGGYEKSSRGIGHISQILFHSESPEVCKKYLAENLYGKERRRQLLTDFNERDAGRAETADPIVSVVIPSRDHPEILEKCLGAVERTAEQLPVEILVVDNGSSENHQKKIEKLIQGLRKESLSVSYLYEPMEFNFSKMCNLGAAAAKGEFLLFLNDDVELAVQGCIGRMAAMAARPYTGAVGIKLYYPESVRIQHAGITNLPMGPVHKLQFHEDNDSYYYGAGRGLSNFLAVTAACLMVERKKFLEAGGFPEELRVAFNDVALCFRLYELGYHNVCINDSFAYHHESLSRGDDESAGKLERLLAERDRLYKRHPGLEGKDPYFSVYLNREGLDTLIRPVYETAGNKTQKVQQLPARKELCAYRFDQCLMVRVEAVLAGEILGWSVVLGDNNACYDKELLLMKTDSEIPEEDEVVRVAGEVYAISLEGQYRPDLQENMPDQVNVALAGFHVLLETGLLPPGRYRIGMASDSRITGLKLANWSNRFAEV